MLPPSWKSDIEDSAGVNREKQEVDQKEAVSNITAAIRAIGDAQNSQTAHEDKNERTNVALALLTIFLVFLTVLFTGLSWCTFRDQLIEMKSASQQTNKIIDANVKLVDAAARQAEAATENAKIAHDNFVASERAWVGPRNAKISNAPASDKDLSIMLEYGNTGREPAVETAFDTEVFTAAEEESANTLQRINDFIGRCKNMWKPDQAAVVYPSVGLSAANYTLTRIMDKSLVDDDVVTGVKTIYFSGCFSYKTAETIHRSWYCYFYKAGKTDNANWNICQTGNGAD